MNAQNENTYSILIVDDDIDQINLLKTSLKKTKNNIYTAMSGTEALTLANNKNFDLILLDICMPEMDGFETFYRLKKIKRTREVPIMFLTSNDQISDIAKGFKLGAVDYITKPFYTWELIIRVNVHLKLKKSNDIIHKQSLQLFDKDKALEKLQNNLNESLKEINNLMLILPVCCSCKKIRRQNTNPNEVKSWINIDSYVNDYSKSKFTQNICPTCKNKLYHSNTP